MNLFKLAAVAAFLALSLGVPEPRSAQAYPGMMCVDTAACGNKCEVCVKAKQTDPTGKCMQIAGCY